MKLYGVLPQTIKKLPETLFKKDSNPILNKKRSLFQFTSASSGILDDKESSKLKVYLKQNTYNSPTNNDHSPKDKDVSAQTQFSFNSTKEAKVVNRSFGYSNQKVPQSPQSQYCGTFTSKFDKRGSLNTKKGIDSSFSNNLNRLSKVRLVAIEPDNMGNVDSVGYRNTPGLMGGESKVNQDSVFISNTVIENAFIVGVFDGHGMNGHKVANYLCLNLEGNLTFIRCHYCFTET